MVREQPQWRLVVESLECYLRDLPRQEQVQVVRAVSQEQCSKTAADHVRGRRHRHCVSCGDIERYDIDQNATTAARCSRRGGAKALPIPKNGFGCWYGLKYGGVGRV